MTGKYESLSGRIKRERMKGPITGLAGEDYALRWLDENPGEVDVLEMTRAEYNEWMNCIEQTDTTKRGAVNMTLRRLGVTVPKPTNEEKLEADLTDWYAKNADARPTLTEHLIERGWVKTLGGTQ